MSFEVMYGLERTAIRGRRLRNWRKTRRTFYLKRVRIGPDHTAVSMTWDYRKTIAYDMRLVGKAGTPSPSWTVLLLDADGRLKRIYLQSPCPTMQMTNLKLRLEIWSIQNILSVVVLALIPL